MHRLKTWEVCPLSLDSPGARCNLVFMAPWFMSKHFPTSSGDPVAPTISRGTTVY